MNDLVHALLRQGSDSADPHDSEQLFSRAVEAGGPEAAWRIIDVYFDRVDGVGAAAWTARAIDLEFPTPSAPSITVDRRTFAPIVADDGSIKSCNASLLISAADRANATSALRAAARRLLLVAEDGTEFPDLETLASSEAVSAVGGPLYTPSYVSDVEEHPLGPWLWMDTDDQMWGLMARTMIRVVLEEFVASGVHTATVGPALGVTGGVEI